jgi:hypothetical protein
MLSKKDFIICMNKIKSNQKYLEKFIKDIGKYFDDIYIFDLGDQSLYNQIEILKIAVENTSGDNWIDWYIYENDWGKKEFTAGYDKDIKPIKTYSDLYDLIVKAQKNN